MFQPQNNFKTAPKQVSQDTSHASLSRNFNAIVNANWVIQATQTERPLNLRTLAEQRAESFADHVCLGPAC